MWFPDFLLQFFAGICRILVEAFAMAGDALQAVADTVGGMADIGNGSTGISFYEKAAGWLQKMFTQENWGVYLIGFIAQLLFSARLLLQWLLSERSRRVQSPNIYWILSMSGAFLLTLYGWFRQDFSIILGQFITYYIYIWNMYEKKIWQPLPVVVRWIFVLTPLVALGFVLRNAEVFFQSFFRNPDVSTGLLIFGSFGQVILTLRFVYQIIYSYHRKESVLPGGFWILSLIGASSIMAYGIFRNDPVLILGQSFGWVAYLRNIMIWSRQKKQKRVSANDPVRVGVRRIRVGRHRNQ